MKNADPPGGPAGGKAVCRRNDGAVVPSCGDGDPMCKCTGGKTTP